MPHDTRDRTQVLLIHQAFASPKDPGGTRHFELARQLVQDGFDFTIIGSTVSCLTGSRPTVLGIDGVIRDVIEAAEGGLFVPPGDARALADAVRRLKDDPELLRRMGQQARTYVVRHFHRANQAQDLARLVAELTGTATPVKETAKRAA